MKEAIQKAIEGGWRPKNWDKTDIDDFGFSQETILSHEVILLDPLFWQALAKVEGWQEKTDRILGTEIGFSPAELTWKYHWHRFIDHLAEGEDAESFFTDLLSNQEKK